MKRESILFLSDDQCPFQHRDRIPFYSAVKQKYKPTRVVHIGDEIDNASLNDYEPDPDSPSHGEELQRAINALQPLYKLFPDVTVLNSNHVGERFHKRRARAGLSERTMKPIKEILEAPSGWHWRDDLTIRMIDGRLLYAIHGMDSDGLRLAKSYGMCTVQGHFHTKFSIAYHSTPHHLHWAMMIGCMLDPKARPVRYAKKNKDRQIIGCGIVEDGQPRLLPMLLNKLGRWTGKVP